MVRAGQLRHRVFVERQSGARDKAGRSAGDWARQVTRSCRIEPKSGEEGVLVGAEAARVTHTITLRFMKGLSAAYRFVEVSTGRVFGIERVLNPDEMNRESVCLCREAV